MPSNKTLQRTLTKALLALSIVYSITGLILPALGFTDIHMQVMLYGSIILFPHAVALAYVASATPRDKQAILGATTLLSTMLALAPIIAILVGQQLASLLTLIPATTMIPASIVAARARKGSARLSLAMVAAAYTFLILALILLTLAPRDPITAAYTLALAYPVPLIIAVTTHSLPSTFHDEPHPLAPLPLTLAGAAALLYYLQGHTQTITILEAITLTTYIYTARIYRTYTTYNKKIGQPKTPAQKGLHYFLTGHKLIPPLILYILYAISTKPTLTALHAYTIGFILHHVIIHAPLMIPVILGIKHKRKYTILPYVTLIIALLTWPLMLYLSLITLLITILLIIKIVL